MVLKDIKKQVLNLIYPKNIKCIVCGCELNTSSHYSMCTSCQDALQYNNKKTCSKCGGAITSMARLCLNCKSKKMKFDKCYSPFIYKGSIVNLIRNLKYNNKKYYAETLGNFIVKSYIENGLQSDVVIPVPLHEKRLKDRGFNQSEVLCQQLKNKLNLTVDIDCVTRIKNTLTQTYLNKDQRNKNVKKAFKVVDKSAIKDKAVLVVDDVYTTGSTLNELSETLLKAGAKSVHCITLAHAYLDCAT